MVLSLRHPPHVYTLLDLIFRSFRAKIGAKYCTGEMIRKVEKKQNPFFTERQLTTIMDLIFSSSRTDTLMEALEAPTVSYHHDTLYDTETRLISIHHAAKGFRESMLDNKASQRNVLSQNLAHEHIRQVTYFDLRSKG